MTQISHIFRGSMSLDPLAYDCLHVRVQPLSRLLPQPPWSYSQQSVDNWQITQLTADYDINSNSV